MDIFDKDNDVRDIKSAICSGAGSDTLHRGACDLARGRFGDVGLRVATRRDTKRVPAMNITEGKKEERRQKTHKKLEEEERRKREEGVTFVAVTLAC